MRQALLVISTRRKRRSRPRCCLHAAAASVGRAAKRMSLPSWRQRRSGARRAAGRVVEHGHASFVNRRDRLELDRLTPLGLEQTDTVTDQDWGDADDGLLQE